MKQGWQIKDFELCLDKTKTTTKLKSSLYGEQGAFPIVSQEKELISGYWDKEEDVFKHKTPIVVFGDHTKVVKYIDFDFVIGADGVKILSPKPFLNPKYFYYWVCSVQIPSHGYARHYRYLKEHQVPVPNLSEQQRIVALLDSEFAKIDALKANVEKNLQNAKDLFQAALKKELEPKEGWREKKIGELFETGSGGTPLKMHKEYYEGGNIPWLRSGEVCKKYITETELFITKLGLDNSSAKFFPTNTIVVAMYGATAGQVGILRMQTTTNQAVCGILPNEHYVPEFVYYSILSKQEELVSQATGNAQPNISQIKIKKLSIPVLPLSDQQSIVARLDTLDEKCKTLQANYEKTLSLCDDLKQALLRKAFNGEI